VNNHIIERQRAGGVPLQVGSHEGAAIVTFYPHICSTLSVRDVVVGKISRALCLITVEKTMPEDEEFNFQCDGGMGSGDIDLMTRIE
jgi:hypothetical protein